ncbi:MAG: tape measure protein [Acinetobacter venetianus]|uniref:tape measure protein n=1 Tax=Acinetobacter venetianus TaxID=52133 RepID=UPI003C73E0B3
MSKDLVFKVVMQGDTNNFDSSVKKSKQTAEQMFQAIGTAVEELEKKTKKSSDSTKNIVSTEAQDRVKDLTAELNAATNVIVALGDKSTISAKEIRTMSQQSQQAISSLKDELAAAQSQYLQLSQAKASPQDIGEAISKITDIKRAIRDVETAFGAYQTVAANAMTGVTKATSITINEIQKFTSVDLNVVISDAQTATRAIESMGDGAVVSTKEIQRISQLGSTAIESLTRELNSAKNAWVDLSNSKGVDLEELTAAKERVQGLERALNLTEASMTEFKGATQQAIPVIDHLDQTLDSTNQELKETESLSQKVSGELAGLKTGFNAVTGALAALGIGATAQEIAQTADEWSNLNARVKIAVGTHGDAKAAMADIIEIARTTNSNLTATGDLYARLTKIGQEMKIPQEQVLQLTKTISQAIQVSGGSAASAEAAITQFQQALASGVLRGDEFNSMMEQSPRLMQALAEGLGVTTGELRKMAGEGKLTTDVVTKAMLSQSAVIQKEFEQFPTTIGSSIENLKTSWTVFIGELDQTHGVSTKVAEYLKWVAENLDAIFNTLKLATQAFIAYKALNIASVFLDKAAGVRVASIAITQETASVVANTQAQLANATATRSASTAKAGLATAAATSSKSVAASTVATNSSLGLLIGRLGALGVAITAFGILVPTVMEPVGTWIGEGLAKQVEKAEIAWHNLNASAESDKRYMTAIEQLEFQMQNEAIAAKVSADMKKEIADAAEKGAIKTYELSKASQDLVNKFNQIVKDGKPTAEALKEVRESMKFDSLTGINNAVSALNMLERTGKITAQELRAELKSALVNEDLVVFQTNAKAAFAGTAQEANKIAQVTQVAMELALERTGLSTEQLQGKFSKAFQSASNDIQMVVGNLDEYKAQGIDTGLALSASLNKAIDTAQSRKELDYVKDKLVEYGNQGKISSEQVALGLTMVEQKAGSLSKALDPVNAAFAAMGIKTKNELDSAATSAEKNFDVIKKSGQATSGSLKQAYQKMVDEVVASGDEVRIARVKAIGESNGLNLEIDKSGRAVVKTTKEIVDALYPIGSAAESATGRAAQGFRELGRVARDEAKSTAQEWEDAMAKIDAERKAKDASNNKGLSELQGGIDQMAQDYYDRLVAAGMDQSRARDLADKARYSLAVETTTSLKGGTTQNMNTTKQEMEKTLAYWENRNSSKSGSGSVSTGNNSPSIQVPSIQAPTIESPKMPKIDTTPDKNVRIELALGGTSTELFGTQDQVDAAQELFRQLEEAKKRS